MASLLITQQNAAKPATELAFPSVTICSSGLNMEAVKEALLDEFNIWLNLEGKAQRNYEDLMDEFMEEKYATKVAEGNIFDQIREMNSPPSTENQDCEGCSTTLQNLAACKEASNGRKKRSTEGQVSKYSQLCNKTIHFRLHPALWHWRWLSGDKNS